MSNFKITQSHPDPVDFKCPTIELTPLDAWAAFIRLERYIKNHAWPQIEFVVDFYDDDDDEMGDILTLCPHCGELNTLVELDQAVRFNDIEVERDERDGALVGRVDEADDEFETFAYVCGDYSGGCGLPVSIDRDVLDIVWH